MNTKRISIGFDLRINPFLQTENPLQRGQHLVPSLSSPISADPAVWLTPEELEPISQGALPPFHNPLHLAKSLEMLEEGCVRRAISITGLWPVCITTCKANVAILVERYGFGYFENQAEEEDLLSQGWQLMGFDIIEMEGALISGLKGCGYAEPVWSKLRNHFSTALNERGLFADACAAALFAEARGLEIREHSPFVVVGILVKLPIA